MDFHSLLPSSKFFEANGEIARCYYVCVSVPIMIAYGTGKTKYRTRDKTSANAVEMSLAFSEKSSFAEDVGR